jgi:hypothetical protein
MKKSMVEIQALEYNDRFRNRTVIVVPKLNCRSVECDRHFSKQHVITTLTTPPPSENSRSILGGRTPAAWVIGLATSLVWVPALV